MSIKEIFPIDKWDFDSQSILLNLPEEKILPTLRDYQREFKSAWQDKPIKHLITLLFVRMAKAYELLRTGNVSIQEAAWNVGYESLSSFSNAFSKNSVADS